MKLTGCFAPFEEEFINVTCRHKDITVRNQSLSSLGNYIACIINTYYDYIKSIFKIVSSL